MMSTETRPDAAALSPQPVLLGFLMLGPAHPYELYRVFDAELGRVWRLGRSHLYAHLGRLADAGLATVRTEARGRRPARNVYSITPAGRKAFREWTRRPSPHVRHMRLEFLARLYFHRRLGLSGLDRLVARQREVLAARMAATRGAVTGTDDAYWRLVLSFRLCEMEAIDAWLDQCADFV
jgi:PadR family transcriptional regulator, regulatory protein AphA